MEHEANGSLEKRRRRRCIIICVAVVLLVIIVLAVALSLARRQATDELESTFIARCEKFKEYDCRNIWEKFTQAFVKRDPCEVPVESYDPLIAAAPFKPACNRMMFWSKTKGLVHDFTGKRDCFITLEDTVLGYSLDGLKWCGKEGSSGETLEAIDTPIVETFTSGCPGWAECNNNSVRSFWTRASAAFADVACGNVTAMLNGSISTPFSPTSTFGSVEVKRFNSTRIRNLNVVLVTKNNTVTNCTNASLKDLQKVLDDGIAYNCKEVAESQIQECSSNPEIPCGACW